VKSVRVVTTKVRRYVNQNDGVHIHVKPKWCAQFDKIARQKSDLIADSTTPTVRKTARGRHRT